MVLDCKYKIVRQQFDDIMKYLEIRCTKTRRQLVKQLWLISPPQPSKPSDILSEDPAVHFDDAGPSCAPEETVRFRLLAAPLLEDATKGPEEVRLNTFQQLAKGTINFLRREFGAKADSGSAP
jgi:hypothetical protein